MLSTPRTALTVSLIILVYNGGANFRACLTSITQAVPQPLELLVVADGDTDGSREVATAFGARVLALPFPDGPARARNVGAISLFLMTVWLLLKGGPQAGPHLQLLGQYFIGYSVTWTGSIVGLFYGAVTGGVLGWLVAWIYNWVAH
jgi:glycosyltransferase involved in cell wall biosynthesis